MAGLLDFIQNLDGQGLLSAGAQMMQASGPSRTPTSFGQIAGAGISSYQDAMIAAQKRKLQEEEAKQMALYRQMQMAEMQEQIAGRAATRKRAGDVSDAYRNMPGAEHQAMAARQRFLGGNIGPTIDATERLSQMPKQAPSTQMYEQLMMQAEHLKSRGLVAEAEAKYKQAIDSRAELKETTNETVGGKTVKVNWYKDGSHEIVDGMLPRDKMEVRSMGGKDVAFNPYTLKDGQTFKHTATPGDILRSQDSAASRAQSAAQFERRLTFDKGGKPTWNSDVGGFVTPPSAANPNGAITPLSGYVKPPKPMTEDQGKATAWLVQASNAYKNMQDVTKANPDAANPGVVDMLAAATPFGMGENAANMLRSGDRQKFMQAASSLSEAALRAATGAGVNIHEAQQKVRELTPVWGDTDAVIKQKMDSIPLYIESLKARAGPGAKMAGDILDGAGNAPVSPPAGAINMLKMNPRLRDQFDQKYGPGAADRALLGK